MDIRNLQNKKILNAFGTNLTATMKQLIRVEGFSVIDSGGVLDNKRTSQLPRPCTDCCNVA